MGRREGTFIRRIWTGPSRRIKKCRNTPMKVENLSTKPQEPSHRKRSVSATTVMACAFAAINSEASSETESARRGAHVFPYARRVRPPAPALEAAYVNAGRRWSSCETKKGR
jgi:hypothetical protein